MMAMYTSQLLTSSQLEYNNTSCTHSYVIQCNSSYILKYISCLYIFVVCIIVCTLFLLCASLYHHLQQSKHTNHFNRTHTDTIIVATMYVLYSYSTIYTHTHTDTHTTYTHTDTHTHTHTQMYIHTRTYIHTRDFDNIILACTKLAQFKAQLSQFIPFNQMLSTIMYTSYYIPVVIFINVPMSNNLQLVTTLLLLLIDTIGPFLILVCANVGQALS